VNKYTVVFEDEDGTELSSAEYDYGTDADDIVKPADPTKAPTAQYTYTFAGWSPAIAEVTGNVTYTATYSSAVNKYTVVFKNADGTELSSAEYDYGTAAADIVKPADPTKAATQQYTYTFSGWSPAIAEVTGDATYTATYSQTENPVVAYVDANGKVHNDLDHSTDATDDDGVQAIPLNGTETTLPAGTYVVNSDVAYTGTVTLSGDVNLILADGKTMTVTNSNDYAIYSESGLLHIFGQSQGTGALTAIANSVVSIKTDDYITINGGIVTATSTNDAGIYGIDGVTINGGTVNATGIYSDGDVTINGGKVTNTSDPGIRSYSGNVILGWTNPDDYIKANSYKCDTEGKAVKTVDGKRLVAYNMADESDISASAIVSGTVDDVTLLAGKTLKPLDGYYLALTHEGATISNDTPDFTISNTPYYVYMENDEVILIHGDTPDGYDAADFVCFTAKDEDGNFVKDLVTTGTFIMPAKDLIISETWKVMTTYVDANGASEVKAIPLNGTEITLGTADTDTWYVCNSNLTYTTGLTLNGNVHLILVDDKTMTIGSDATPVTDNGFYNANGSIHIYGQSEKTGKLTVFAELNGIYTINGNIDIVGCQVEATTIFEDGYGKDAILAESGDIILKDADVTVKGYRGIATDVNSSQQQGDATETEESLFGNLTICGGKVDATAEYAGFEVKGAGAITLTDAVVTTEGGFNGISSESDIIISGGNVTATSIGVIFLSTDPNTTSTVLKDGHAIFASGKIVIKTTENSNIEKNNTITVSGYYGIVTEEGDISIDGCTVHATTEDIALYANGVTLKDANITANGARGIFARADGLTVNGGTIVATGTGDYSAINVLIGDITLTDADITATSENAYAIKVVEGVINGGEPGEVVLQSGALTIIGGKVTATATGTGEDVGGLYADGDIILGWNKTTDFIKATSYDVGDSHTVSVNYGQAFKSEDGTVGCVNTLTNDEVTAIAGLKLIPTGAHRLYTAGTTNEWMTWCCSDELLIPVQLTAYTIEGVNNGTVTLSDALTTVPAYTPVLIKRAGKSLAEDIYAAAKEEGTAPNTGYDTATGLAWTTAQGLTFWGNAKNAAISEGGFTANGLTAYNLYNGRFYRLKGDLNINANRCILTVDGNTNAAVLSISEEITSLTPIPSPKGEGREYFYTLDGRRLEGKPTQKGIYIVNGKKRVVK
jgi:hypothetical protein